MDKACARIKIDLASVRHNYMSLCNLVNQSGNAVSAVVKSDAYGLGAHEVSRALFDAGCRDFWANNIGEAMSVRSLLPLDANIYYLH
jgi:alanine racemase